MKKSGLIFILIFLAVFANAQNYKDTFVQLLKYSDSGFKDILGQKIEESPDGTAVFYRSNLELKVGFAEIGLNKDGIGSAFTWQIPLDKSDQVMMDLEDFIQKEYGNDSDYYIAKEGSKSNGHEMISVSDGFGLIFINVLYNKDQKNLSNSGYFIQIIGN